MIFFWIIFTNSQAVADVNWLLLKTSNIDQHEIKYNAEVNKIIVPSDNNFSDPIVGIIKLQNCYNWMIKDV